MRRILQNSSMDRISNKKHLKNVGPIRYCEPPLHCQSPGVASRTPAIAIAQAACDVHNDDNDNAWQRGPLWPHGMGPMKRFAHVLTSHHSHTIPDVGAHWSIDHSRYSGPVWSPYQGDWNHKSGRPRQIIYWLHTIESDVAPLNTGLATAYHQAQNCQA